MPNNDVLSDMVFPQVPDTSASQAPKSVAVGASPFKYVATTRQALHVTGGSISTVSYARGTLLLALGIVTGGQLIELNAGDAVTIAYLTTPTLTVIPR